MALLYIEGGGATVLALCSVVGDVNYSCHVVMIEIELAFLNIRVSHQAINRPPCSWFVQPHNNPVSGNLSAILWGGEDGTSPLHLAAKSGELEVVEAGKAVPLPIP